MGQIMLVLGAFTLLIFLTMTVNQAISNRMDDTFQAEAVIAATSIAQSMLTEVAERAFDDSALVYPADTTGQLTPVYALGPEPGETFANGGFDDIDDFKGFVRTDTIVNGAFTTTVDVCYIDPLSPESILMLRSFYKKITVTVTSKELKNIPITLSRLVSY